MGSARRAVQFDVNATQFERFGERSIKGFCKFNPGWNVVIHDRGLTDAQRTLLESTNAEICSSPSPLQNLRDLLDDYDIVLHLNIATFTFASLDPWIVELESGVADISAGIRGDSLRIDIRDVARTVKVLGVDDEVLDRVRLDTGVMLLRKTDKIISVLDKVLNSREQLDGSARGQEGIWLSALIWQRDCTVLIPKEGYIAYPTFTPQLPSSIEASDHPITRSGEEILILYFRHEKHHFTRIDGWKGLGYRMWVAWCDATKHFLELPWTT